MRKHHVKFQSDEISLYEEILDMMEQIDLMAFCLIIDDLNVVTWKFSR